MPVVKSLFAETSDFPTRRQYRKAPIIETALEILASVPEDVSADSLGELFPSEQAKYSQKYEVSSFTAGIAIDATGSLSAAPTTKPDKIGYVFIDPEGHRLFQARRNGFLHIKQAPYDRWESFRDEARRLWMLYLTHARPTKVHRLGLRYVNRLDLPIGNTDLKEYLLTAPDIAPGIAQTLSNYTMQLDIPQPDLPEGLMVIREAVIQPQIPNTIAIVLDIDVLRAEEFVPADSAVWAAFEDLHLRASAAFERSITDRLREIIG
jgi:uncharacterized protein (TIGR04255 family)